MQPVRHGERTQAEHEQAYEDPPPAPPPPAEPTEPDPMAQVSELAKLHEAGALTDEEFAAAKAKALGI